MSTANRLPMVPRVALVELAKAVDQLLSKQERGPSWQREVLDAERRMRQRCKEIITNPAAQATIFQDDAAAGVDFVGLVVAIELEGILEAIQDEKFRVTRQWLKQRLGPLVSRLRHAVPVANGGAP